MEISKRKKISTLIARVLIFIISSQSCDISFKKQQYHIDNETKGSDTGGKCILHGKLHRINMMAYHRDKRNNYLEA